MTITSTVAIDLVDRDRYPLAQVYAKQDDSLSRAIAASIYAAGVAWVPPSGATAVIRYRRPDGIGGIYDELPDGSVAYTISDNVITAYIAPDALSCPGRVRMDIVIVNGTEALATFDISVLVDAAPTSGVAPTNGYYKYKTLADINAALAARVQSVNDQTPDNKGNVRINAEQTGAVSQTAFDAAMTTVVKKVNGVTPDANGNVNVSAESGGNVLSVNGNTGAVQIPTPASGVCGIGAEIPTKVVESVSPGASPVEGGLVYVKFEAANTAGNPTLTFMGYTAPIVDGGGNAVAPGALTAGTHGFQRRGKTWVLLDGSGAAGEDGGYYAPSVDSGGNLTWTASKAGMPQVSGANIKGHKGDTGVGIASIARTSGTGAAGTTDTYTITLTDGSTSTFTVYNGKDGASGSGTETTTHGIVWDLVNVTSSNNSVSVADGASLVAVLTPADGYTLGDVIVTMGGVDITADVWNAETATIIIEAVTGDVAISCAGVGDVQIIPVFSYGNINSATGSADDSPARQHSELINCMTKGLRIDVPATSDYYAATTGAIKITYSVFAYDADGNYISGVDSSGKVLESAATFGGWLTCNYGESIYLPSGYQYVFVNSNSARPKPFDSNGNALAFCNSGELKFYLIVGGDSGSTTTTNEEASVMMLSFNRAYVDTGEYTEDLLPKWDGMFSIHRGYSTAPDNTLQAIWEAKKHGYNCCELDVRYSSDNYPVLCHYATVTGTVDGESVTYTIAETPLATLQTVCIGNTVFPDAKVCSLEDAMRLCRRIGMRPEIDYKISNEQLYKDCVALSMKYGLQDDTLHCCYSIPYALTIKAAYEKANLRVAGELLDSDTSLDEYLPKPGNLYAFYSAAACGKTDGSNVGANVGNETRIMTHKAKGYKMYVWNVTPYLLPDVMQWEPDILQPQSAKDGSDWYTLIRELSTFDGLVF